VVEDDGEFEVPAELVTQLVDLGLSGFPSAALGRRSTDGVRVEPGCIDLRISSEITVELEVDGLISCTSNADCPEGQSCSAELACLDEE
jgi:Cys-rich repeat protein